MKMLCKWAFCACVALAMACPAEAAPGRYAQQRSRPTPSPQSGCGPGADAIQQRIVGMMRGAQYLGFICDPSTYIYTFKFLRNGTVIWVDVDGRTGKIVRQVGA